MLRSRLHRLIGRYRYFRNIPSVRKHPWRGFFRVLEWRFFCLIGRARTLSIPAWGCRFFLPPWWQSGGTTHFYVTREEYEPEVKYLEKLLRPGDVFIDGGANLGIYSMAAAACVGPAGRVIAFEPQTRVLAILQKNIELNQSTQIEAHALGLAEREGEASLYSACEGVVNASLGTSAGTASVQTINLTSLDRFFEKHGLNRLDVLKIDVEGAEELVLRGAASTLEKHRPKIIFEVNPIATTGLKLEVDGAWQILKRLNYAFFAVREDGALEPATITEDVTNVIALPQPVSETSGRSI